MIRFATGVDIIGRLNIYASKAGARTFSVTIKKLKKAVWLRKTTRQLTSYVRNLRKPGFGAYNSIQTIAVHTS